VQRRPGHTRLYYTLISTRIHNSNTVHPLYVHMHAINVRENFHMQFSWKFYKLWKFSQLIFWSSVVKIWVNPFNHESFLPQKFSILMLTISVHGWYICCFNYYKIQISNKSVDKYVTTLCMHLNIYVCACMHVHMWHIRIMHTRYWILGTSLLCFFLPIMLCCSSPWISPKMLKIMLTICVSSGQWMTNTNNNNFYCVYV